MMSYRAAKLGVLAVVFAAVAAFYWGTYSFRGINDTTLNSLQTRALVLHGDVDLSRYKLDETRFFALRRGPHFYSIYGVGVSIVAAPLYAPLARMDLAGRSIQGIVGVLFVAGSVVVMCSLLAGRFTRAVAAAGTVVYGFGTTMWPLAAMAFWQQAPVAFFEALGLAAFLGRGRHGPVLSGLALGVATFVRPSLAILLLFVGLYHLREDRRALVRFVGGAALPLIAVLVQNRWIWGSWLFGGYANAGNGIYWQKLGSGLFGELLGWWRGLLVYSPVLILGYIGWVMALRQRDELSRKLVFVGAACVVLTLLYGGFRTWWGGENQFGYRYLLDITPALVVLACYAVARQRRFLTLAVPLGVVSILTMTFGSAPHRAGWDSHAFTGSFVLSPIGQAWMAFFDRPWGGLLRLAGIAAMAAFIRLVMSRLQPAREPDV